jgi:hypothetical protein
MSAVFSGFVRACVRLTTLSLVIALGATWGQGTGEITGTVTDATAAAINGAKIRVINAATAAERAVTTNDVGNYDVTALVLGIYDLKTEFRGFRTSERKGVELQVAQVARLDFSCNRATSATPSRSPAARRFSKPKTPPLARSSKANVLPICRRNPLQLVSLTPGATTNGPASSQGQPRMGRARNAFSTEGRPLPTRRSDYDPTTRVVVPAMLRPSGGVRQPFISRHPASASQPKRMRFVITLSHLQECGFDY